MSYAPKPFYDELVTSERVLSDSWRNVVTQDGTALALLEKTLPVVLQFGQALASAGFDTVLNTPVPQAFAASAQVMELHAALTRELILLKQGDAAKRAANDAHRQAYALYGSRWNIIEGYVRPMAGFPHAYGIVVGPMAGVQGIASVWSGMVTGYGAAKEIWIAADKRVAAARKLLDGARSSAVLEARGEAKVYRETLQGRLDGGLKEFEQLVRRVQPVIASTGSVKDTTVVQLGARLADDLALERRAIADIERLVADAARAADDAVVAFERITSLPFEQASLAQELKLQEQLLEARHSNMIGALDNALYSARDRRPKLDKEADRIRKIVADRERQAKAKEERSKQTTLQGGSSTSSSSSPPSNTQPSPESSQSSVGRDQEDLKKSSEWYVRDWTQSKEYVDELTKLQREGLELPSKAAVSLSEFKRMPTEAQIHARLITAIDNRAVLEKAIADGAPGFVRASMEDDVKQDTAFFQRAVNDMTELRHDLWSAVGEARAAAKNAPKSQQSSSSSSSSGGSRPGTRVTYTEVEGSESQSQEHGGTGSAPKRTQSRTSYTQVESEGSESESQEHSGSGSAPKRTQSKTSYTQVEDEGSESESQEHGGTSTSSAPKRTLSKTSYTQVEDEGSESESQEHGGTGSYSAPKRTQSKTSYTQVEDEGSESESQEKAGKSSGSTSAPQRMLSKTRRPEVEDEGSESESQEKAGKSSGSTSAPKRTLSKTSSTQVEDEGSESESQDGGGRSGSSRAPKQAKQPKTSLSQVESEGGESESSEGSSQSSGSTPKPQSSPGTSQTLTPSAALGEAQKLTSAISKVLTAAAVHLTGPTDVGIRKAYFKLRSRADGLQPDAFTATVGQLRETLRKGADTSSIVAKLETWLKAARQLRTDVEAFLDSITGSSSSSSTGSKGPKTKPDARFDPFEKFERALTPTFANPERFVEKLGPRGAFSRATGDLQLQVFKVDVAADAARPFVPKAHEALFSSVATLDAQLEKAKAAKTGAELGATTREVAETLGRMAGIAKTLGFQSAATVKAVQALMDQRREALARLAAGYRPGGKAQPIEQEQLDQVTRNVPGLSKVLPPRQPGRNKSGGLASLASSKVAQAVKARDKGALLSALAPNGNDSLKGLSQVRYKVADFLGGAGAPARTWSVFSKLQSGFSAMKNGISSLKTTVKGGLSNIANKAVGGLAAVGKTVQGGLASVAQKAGGALSNLATKGLSLATKTAKALGSGIRAVSSKIGDAATTAWNVSKQAVRTIGNGASSLAEKTGGFFKGLWTKTTGVVGAIGGKIKSGLSSAANWVGDKAKKVGGALLGAAKFAGNAFLKYHPLGKALKFGWDKFGKAAWDKTKSFASVAWSKVKTVGASVGNFLQSPAGQLLTTGLSVAASFIPGGLLVKAGIGAVVGAIEAVSKGGGWKEALMGAAAGGIEGALPFLKIGAVGKLALGGIKGGLQTAVSGGSFGDIAKGALGGAWDAGGGAVLKKFGGGRGLKMLGQFVGGEKKKGALGLLQKGSGKLWDFGQKHSAKIVKGATWLWDKTDKLHNGLEKVTKYGGYAKSALEGVSGFSEWASSKLDKDSAFGGFLKDVSSVTGAGASGLKTGLEYVKTVDEYVEGAHKVLNFGLKTAGVNPKKELAKQQKRTDTLVKSRKAIEESKTLSPDEKAAWLKRWDGQHGKSDIFDRIDVWTGTTSNKASKRGLELLEKGRGKAEEGLLKLPFGAQILKGGKKGADFVAWAHGHSENVTKVIDSGVKVGKTVQTGLRNLVLLTEGVDEKQFGGGAISWIHEQASSFEEGFSTGLKYAKSVQGIAHLTNGAAGAGLGAIGYDKEKKKAYDKSANVWWGKDTVKTKDGADAKTVGGFRSKGVKEDETLVAPWVKWFEKKPGEATEKKAPSAAMEKFAAYKKAALEKAKKGRDKAAKRNGYHGDGANAAYEREEALLRLAGAEAGDLDEDWKEFEKRKKEKKAAALTAAPAAKTAEPAQVTSQISEAVAKHAEKKAADEAKDIERLEKAPAPKDFHEEVQKKEADAAKKDGAPVEAKDGAPVEAKDGKKTGLEALEPAPTTTLETVATPDGVAGGMEEPGPANGLSVLGTLNQGFLQNGESAASISQAPEFRLLSWYIDTYEEKLLGDLPRLEHFTESDPKQARVFYEHLLREGGNAEFELARLEKAYAPDSAQGRALVAFAERYAALRSKLKGVGAKASKAELPTAPELKLLRPDGKPATETIEAALTSEPATTTEGKPTPGAGADQETYLGETIGDTWIGAGGAARSIADGLATGFKFDDRDGAEPTIGGALARLGGALQGLGGSVKGASGDVGELFGEVKGSSDILGDMAGTVGELFTGKRDNKVTELTGKASDFSNQVMEGADKVSGYADKVTEAGGKLHEFGAKMEEKGFKLFGKVYRKGKPGTRDAEKAPVADANQYLDAPKRLDISVMSQMERFLGGRLGDVKIHTGAGADLITKRYDAEAVTIRDHIFFAPGRYNPHSTEGRKLLAHELTHVQQRGRPNLDTRTAEAEAHRNEALFGTPGMEILNLSTPQPDFHINMAGAEQTSGVRTAKRQRSISSDSSSFDEGVEGEELLDLVGERVYELMLEDVEKDFENR